MKSLVLPERLSDILKAFQIEFDHIPSERKKTLEQLGSYISNKIKAGQPAKVIVICTHNSRRSHIAQLWLQVAADYFGIDKVETHSGGTEATAFNHRSVVALRKAGFPLIQRSESSNPVYRLDFATEVSPSSNLFSKKFDEPPNPVSGFAAVMVCSEADAGCPFVPGVDVRFSIPYEDPKEFDDTPNETQAYDERVHQIGREMCYSIWKASSLL